MENLSLLTDLYQLTMMQGFYLKGKHNQEVVFDRFYRANPCQSGYSLVAGLQHAIDYLQNLHFEEDDLHYLKSLNLFHPDFIKYLQDFRFSGSIWAAPEGTVVFPNEPLLRVQAKRNEAIFIETALSMILNHESLIATRASRMRRAAGQDFLSEFGLRRAQGVDAALYGARAAIIGGFDATSNVLAGKNFDLPVVGTMAHSWVMGFENELEAFRVFVQHHQNSAMLLVDTYDTLGSGVPNAIGLFEELRQQNRLPAKYGIRLDSGDLAYLSKAARQMLNAAGFDSAMIMASSDLDEYLISELKQQGAQIEAWGVGTKLITSEGCSSFGGVYKLAAEIGPEVTPKIKISNDPEKVTNPGIKTVFRLYDRQNNKIIADVIALANEQFCEKNAVLLTDEKHPWRRIRLLRGTFKLRELLIPIFVEGKCIYETSDLWSIRQYAQQELDTLWTETRRLVQPQPVKVDLSDKLYDLKKAMIYNAVRHV